MKTIDFYRHEARVCACGCGRRFHPTPTIGPVSTELYLSAFHAMRARAIREGWGVVPEIPEDGDTGTGNGTRPRGRGRVPRPPHVPSEGQDIPSAQGTTRGDRWGPKRNAVADLELRSGGRARRVRLECGHESTLTMGRTWGRCRKCLRPGGSDHAEQ